MRIKCGKCGSEFNLNENLIKKDGSTVRCSVCKNVFKVFPPEQDLFDSPIDDDFSNTAMEETVALDFSPDFESEESETIKKDMEYSFDRAFEEAMEEVVEDEELIVPEEEPAPEKEQDTTELQEEKTDSVAVKMDGVKKKAKERPKILLISLSIVLALIIAFLIIFFFFPGILPDSLYLSSSAIEESTIDAGIDELDYSEVNGSFSNSDKAGRLYIIKGSVINNNQKDRSFILLKGSILNKEGTPVKQETAYAGNILSDEELNNMSADDIKSAMKIQTGIDNNNVDVKPGSSVPFMIVFSDLPDDMSEFTLEAVSSSYGE